MCQGETGAAVGSGETGTEATTSQGAAGPRSEGSTLRAGGVTIRITIDTDQ